MSLENELLVVPDNILRKRIISLVTQVKDIDSRFKQSAILPLGYTINTISVNYTQIEVQALSTKIQDISTKLDLLISELKTARILS